MERKIVHFDGDSFFASVEQAMHLEFRGKPIITGGERGAITSVSIEAKRRGVSRGLSLGEARSLCPELIVVPSDYITYSIFAKRMYAIVRTFTPVVEEYSIDECFADITDIKTENQSYEDIALSIKEKLEKSLGITFGVGLGPNKVLAKTASKHRKPAGFTSIFEEDLQSFLEKLPVGSLWGIGPSASRFLQSKGIRTAFDFASKEERWLLAEGFARPVREIWRELKGEYVKELSSGEEAYIPKSVISSGTFRPHTKSKSKLLSELSQHIEEVSFRIRLYKCKAKHIRFYVKTTEFKYISTEVPLAVPLSSASELQKMVEENFEKIYRGGVLYRTTGVCLSGIIPEGKTADDLFGESIKQKNIEKVFSVVDATCKRFGREIIHLASSLESAKLRGKKTFNTRPLSIPFLGITR